LYDAETWTLRKVDQKYLESIEKIGWAHRVRNEEQVDPASAV